MLAELVAEAPPEALKKCRVPGKWSIHEHACHIVDVHPMLIERFALFRDEETPIIKPFIPGTTVPDTDLIERDLDAEIAKLPDLRLELIESVEALQDHDWTKKAKHPEYISYTPYILLRHILMHDHLHMYRIEELLLTTDDYLPTTPTT